MGLLEAMKSLFGGGGDEAGYWVYVRCARCGEAIKTRIDLQRDLSARDEGGFKVHKTMVGSGRCFERIEVDLTFDDDRRLVERQIARGEFITAEEYATAAGA